MPKIETQHSVFSATLLLSITALFREPKAREDHPTLIETKTQRTTDEIFPYAALSVAV
jgi:hypothetical protein